VGGSLLAQLTDVRCTNCGADWWTKAAAIATLAALAIAVAAFVVARDSAKSADESLRITREQFDLAKEEHGAFLRELRARPELHVDIRPHIPEAPSDGIVRANATQQSVVIKIEVRNAGDRDAGAGRMEIDVPGSIGGTMHWADFAGRRDPDAPSGTARTSEGLYVMTRPLDMIGRDVGATCFARVYVPVPETGVDQHLIRVRVAAEGAGPAIGGHYWLRVARGS
jgi:hypothetical protein